MIKVEVCVHCKEAAGEKGIELMEELKKYEKICKEKNIHLEVEETGCLGGCRGPVVQVNGVKYMEVTKEQIASILDELI